MMNSTKMRSLAFALIAMTLAGCAGTEPSNYYLLSALPAPETPIRATPSDQLAVGVGPVTLPMYLDRPQLVTRASPNRLDLAAFNKFQNTNGFIRLYSSIITPSYFQWRMTKVHIHLVGTGQKFFKIFHADCQRHNKTDR